MVAERRRKRQIRPRHNQSRRCQSDVKRGRSGTLFQTLSFPRWIACAGYLDDKVGGGLGVDYDGSRSDFDSSTNYSLQEYANDVVWNIMDVCDSEGVAHPTIVSESGRAIVAHHSVLVVEAFSSIEKTAPKLKVEA